MKNESENFREFESTGKLEFGGFGKEKTPGRPAGLCRVSWTGLCLVLLGCSTADRNNSEYGQEKASMENHRSDYLNCVRDYSGSLAKRSKESSESIAEASLSECGGRLDSAKDSIETYWSIGVSTPGGRRMLPVKVGQVMRDIEIEARRLAVKTVIETRMEK